MSAMDRFYCISKCFIYVNMSFFTLDPACRTQGNGNYVTDNSCRSYYSCNSGFRINVGTCNSGTYFNVISGNCQTQIPPGQGCVGKSGFWRLLYLKLTVCKLWYWLSHRRTYISTAKSNPKFQQIHLQIWFKDQSQGCVCVFWRTQCLRLTFAKVP